MKRTWSTIAVADRAHSFRSYQTVFGQAATSPGHDDFGQIVDTDGTVLLCLHQSGAHEHLPLASPNHSTPGNRLILFFRVDHLDAPLPKARSLSAALQKEPASTPHENDGIRAV
jgi:predicted enzyme related to lactoylglutathione lyase